MPKLSSLKKSSTEGVLLDAEVVRALLPQKAPFAFVDEILELDEGTPDVLPSIVGRYHVTGEEEFFKGHFPGNPVMPGVLQIESMAQAATLLTMIAKCETVEGKRPAFIGVENCRFRSPVAPGMDLSIRVSMTTARRTVFKYSGKIFCGEILVCEADFSAAML